MRIKWNFHDGPTPTWKRPKGYPSLNSFSIQIEKELFELVHSCLGYSNFSKEEWQPTRSLANDKSMVIKKGRQGFMCCCLGPE